MLVKYSAEHRGTLSLSLCLFSKQSPNGGQLFPLIVNPHGKQPLQIRDGCAVNSVRCDGKQPRRPSPSTTTSGSGQDPEDAPASATPVPSPSLLFPTFLEHRTLGTPVTTEPPRPLNPSSSHGKPFDRGVSRFVKRLARLRCSFASRNFHNICDICYIVLIYLY